MCYYLIMFEFKKKETLIENISFMALMSAINLIIALLMTFIPYIIAFSLIFLPLTSVLVTLYCKKKYFIFYFLTTLGLCLLITMYNITDTLFFVLPSLISGFLFGSMVNFKFHSLYLIIIPSFINLIFTYLSVPFIQLIYGFNFIDKILMTFSLDTFPLKDVIVPSIVLLFSLIQSLFSYMVIKEELTKFKFDISNDESYRLINIIVVLFCLVAILVFSFFYLTISYIFLLISIFITCYIFIKQLITFKKIALIANISFILITFFIFSICYQYVENSKALLLISVFCLLVSIFEGVNIYLQWRANKSKIKSEAID